MITKVEQNELLRQKEIKKIPSSELLQPLKRESKIDKNSTIIEVSSLDERCKKEPIDANLEKNKNKNQKTQSKDKADPLQILKSVNFPSEKAGKNCFSMKKSDPI